jgi:hypothetical protein
MLMDHSLTFSQSKLTTFLTCRRRFYLRYRARLPWPEPPLPAEQEEALSLGHQFHQLLERYFLGLPVEEALGGNGRLRHWWSQFQSHPPVLPPGRRLPEVGLTVPLVSVNSDRDSDLSEQWPLLVGRFDLVILGETEAGQPAVHIYDWKTGRPQPLAELRQSWQTRLYLALAAEGGGALFSDQYSVFGERKAASREKTAGESGRLIPEAVRLTYWYVNEPDQPRTIAYSQTAHEENWAEVTAVAAQIMAAMAAEAATEAGTETAVPPQQPSNLPDTLWPKTEDWSRCAYCAYQAYCGRQGAVAPSGAPDGATFVGKKEEIMLPDESEHDNNLYANDYPQMEA